MRDFSAPRALGIEVQEGNGRPVLVPAKLEAQSQFLNIGKKADSAVGFWSIFFFLPILPLVTRMCKTILNSS